MTKIERLLSMDEINLVFIRFVAMSTAYNLIEENKF
jgi:hypothetical protein